MGAAIKLRGGEQAWPRVQRRSSPRASTFLCVDLCSEHDFWTGLTMNLSEGGVFVATHVSLPQGTLLGLHFELPRTSRRIMTLGDVRWSRTYTGNDDVPPGMGIQFVGLDEASLLAIRAFVTSLLEPLRFER